MRIFLAGIMQGSLTEAAVHQQDYRERIRQCEGIGEFALAEQIRKILIQEQDHQIDLATALGIEVPNVGGG